MEELVVATAQPETSWGASCADVLDVEAVTLTKDASPTFKTRPGWIRMEFEQGITLGQDAAGKLIIQRISRQLSMRLREIVDDLGVQEGDKVLWVNRHYCANWTPSQLKEYEGKRSRSTLTIHCPLGDPTLTQAIWLNSPMRGSISEIMSWKQGRLVLGDNFKIADLDMMRAGDVVHEINGIPSQDVTSVQWHSPVVSLMIEIQPNSFEDSLLDLTKPTREQQQWLPSWTNTLYLGSSVTPVTATEDTTHLLSGSANQHNYRSVSMDDDEPSLLPAMIYVHIYKDGIREMDLGLSFQQQGDGSMQITEVRPTTFDLGNYLHAGMKLLSINNETAHNFTQIRQGLKRSRVSITAWNPQGDNHLVQVAMNKWTPREPWGLVFTGPHPHLYLWEIDPRCYFASAPLSKYDEMVSLNGISCRGMGPMEADSILRGMGSNPFVEVVVRKQSMVIAQPSRQEEPRTPRPNRSNVLTFRKLLDLAVGVAVLWYFLLVPDGKPEKRRGENLRTIVYDAYQQLGEASATVFQERTFQYMLRHDDTKQWRNLPPNEIVQRYALVLIFMNVVGTGFPSTASVCEWSKKGYIVRCNENRTVEELQYAPGGVFWRTVFPPEIGLLTGLKVLNMSNSFTGQMPRTLGHLEELTSLVLSGVHLATIPTEIGNLSSLSFLDLSNNTFHSVPSEIFLPPLEYLDLGHNYLSSIPDELGDLTQLTHLELVDNRLSHLPAVESSLPPFPWSEMGRLSHLSYLNVGHNRLRNIDLSSAPVSLTSLNLQDCRLASLPGELGRLSQLEELDLGHNYLPEIVFEIGNLSNLSRLDLRINQLTSLPEMTQLSKLEFLDLSYNVKMSTSVLAQLQALDKLQYLHLDGTCLDPRSLCSRNYTVLIVDGAWQQSCSCCTPYHGTFHAGFRSC